MHAFDFILVFSRSSSSAAIWSRPADDSTSSSADGSVLGSVLRIGFTLHAMILRTDPFRLLCQLGDILRFEPDAEREPASNK